MSIATVALCAVLVVGSASQQPVPSGVPAPDPTQKIETTAKIVPAPATKPASGGTIATADDLLAALESAGNDMRTLQADLRRTRIFPDLEGGGKQEWQGRVLFDNPAPKAPGQPVKRRFQIEFDFSVRDGGVKQNDGQIFIFDGEWLIERKNAEKQMTKRQMVPPGQNIDPLSLDTGIFPLPIGQKKQGILERFDAVLLKPEDFQSFQGGTFPAALKDTYQMKLTPKPGTPGARDLNEIRIWYRKDDLLPRMAYTAERNGSSNEYFLTKMRTKDPLPATAFDTTTPPGWPPAQVELFRAEKPKDK